MRVAISGHFSGTKEAARLLSIAATQSSGEIPLGSVLVSDAPKTKSPPVTHRAAEKGGVSFVARDSAGGVASRGRENNWAISFRQ